jgi:hypothetical protein
VSPAASRGRAGDGPRRGTAQRCGRLGPGALCWVLAGQTRLQAPKVGSPVPGFWAQTHWVALRIPKGASWDSLENRILGLGQPVLGTTLSSPSDSWLSSFCWSPMGCRPSSFQSLNSHAGICVARTSTAYICIQQNARPPLSSRNLPPA